ncbi:minor capsid protein [Clostridium culturomicium]|uniref:minor capsid protein n=1 Tax=Clostridium culturomicium TaxID=1499683 RepID=UPI0038576C33
MSKYNNYAEFLESLYKMSNEELKELYKLLKKNKDKVSQKIADILYKYTINDGVMDIKKVERVKLYRELSETITTTTNAVGVAEVALTEKVLEIIVQDTFKFWNYNINYEDVRNIIKKNFKGKHFSDRVWENEEEVAKRLHKLTHDFLDGKINVNQIKRDLEKIFNADAYNVKRLVETEVSRCSTQAFERFAKETGVKRVRRNEILDSKTCDECESHDGDEWDFDDPNRPSLPEHPLCRGFWDIVE